MKYRITVVATLLLLIIASFAYGMTTADDGASALAEYACEDSGGVAQYGFAEEGGGHYAVAGHCMDGSSFEGSFNCPGCREG